MKNLFLVAAVLGYVSAACAHGDGKHAKQDVRPISVEEHAEMMKKHPTMEHDEFHMAHVAPGKTESMVWQFTKAGEFYYGCLVPGHFEGGMIGQIRVLERGDRK